jgi:hypothetical protein
MKPVFPAHRCRKRTKHISPRTDKFEALLTAAISAMPFAKVRAKHPGPTSRITLTGGVVNRIDHWHRLTHQVNSRASLLACASTRQQGLPACRKLSTQHQRLVRGCDCHHG